MRPVHAMVLVRRAVFATPVAVLALVAGAHAWTPATVALGEAPPVLAGATALGELTPTAQLKLTVVLAPRDPAGLAALATAVSTPGSPEYHRYVNVRQFAARFGAAKASLTALRATLRASGLRPGQLAANGLSLSVAGTAAQVSRAFSISLRRFRERGGRQLFANTTAPRVPAALGGVVTAVLGLDDLPAAVPLGLARRRGARAASVPLASGNPPTPCAAASQEAASAHGTYTINQVAHAYGIDGLYGQNDLGAGVTIALYELEGYAASDIAAFQSCFGTNATVTNVQVDGGPSPPSPQPPSNPGLESALDIENVIGLSPQSRIEVYQGPNTAQGIYDTFAAIVGQDIAQVVSDSWGLCEPTLTQLAPALLTGENTLLQQAAAQGQTVLVASGDSGSDGCGDGGTAVDDPASQPFATGVGGTTLSSAGPPPAQTVWNQGSGGGISAVWPMPAYQSAPGVVNSFSSGTPCAAVSGNCREVPDVSADASPSTGYVVYYSSGSGWGVVGGTSAAAPVWAGLIALADASGGSPGCAGRMPLGFLNPQLYLIASGANHADAFSDVTVGDNNPSGHSPDPYPATAGYDMATGLGTPIATGNVDPLVAQLCAADPAITAAPTVNAVNAADAAPGATVTINGSGFTSTAAVSFGSAPASSVTLISYNQLAAAVPAGAGAVDVTVHTANGASATSASDRFVYAPTASIAAPAAGAIYTLGQRVAASYACTSALGPPTCSGSVATGGLVDTSSLGPHSFTVIATDSNSVGTQQTVSYTIVAAPAATITTPASGAVYTQDETLHATYTCTASAPGAATCLGTVPSGKPIDTATPGVRSFTVTATDANGVSTAAVVNYTVVARARITVKVPAAGAEYLRGRVARARFSCAANAPVVIARCRGTVASGTVIATASLGVHHFAVTATDSNGVSRTATITYTVVALTPTLTRLRQSVATWVEARHAGTRLPVGTTFTFSLDQAARVTLRFTRDAGGRTLSAGTVTLTATAGAGTYRFSGRTSTGRLAPGTYTLSMTATGASGRTSTIATVRFTIAVMPTGG